MDVLFEKLFKPSLPVLTGKLKCAKGHSVSTSRSLHLPDVCVSIVSRCTNIQEFVDSNMAQESNLRPCRLCRGAIYKCFYFTTPPRILSFSVADSDVEPNKRLTISTSMGVKEYQLKGIVYFQENHFTSRIIGRNNKVWFHDGLEPEVRYDGLLTALPDLHI